MGPLVKSFLKIFLLMILRSFVTICLCYLSVKREFLHLHVKLSAFVKNTSKSRSCANKFTMKNLVDKGRFCFLVTFSKGNFTSEVKETLTSSLVVTSIPLF